MSGLIYKSSSAFKKETAAAFSLIRRISAENIDLETLKENIYVIRRAFLSVCKTLKATSLLPSNDGKLPRIYEYAREYCFFGGNTIKPEALLEYMITVSDRIFLQNDEICAFPDVFKAALIMNIAKEAERETSGESYGRIRAAVEALRTLNSYIFDDLYEKLSKCESALKKDDTYCRSDKASKDIYRHKIAQMAKQRNMHEIDVVNMLLEKAGRVSSGKKSAIGYYLFGKSKLRSMYFPAVSILTATIFSCVMLLSGNFLIALFAVIPVWEISRRLTDKAFSYHGANYVTRLKLRTCPKTLVTVITLISDEKSIDELCEKCVRYYFTNRTEGLMFGFLADLPSSHAPLSPADNQLVEYARKKTEALNNKYGKAFFSAVRQRTVNKDNGKYMGRERKRGAVEDFLRLAEFGEDTPFLMYTGNISGAKYFAALDNDTRPDIDSVAGLVGVLENPLNEPRLNLSGSVVTEGYGIAVPRIEPELKSTTVNLFTKIFGGKGGSELYDNPYYSTYQDIFGEGIFAGKGVINIELFNRVLHKLFRPDTVLSHDILEGGFLRTVYVSDIIFYDGVPKNFISYVSRAHRWVRGDWQNSGFMSGKIAIGDGSLIKNPLNTLSRFKIFDNMIRSLVPADIFLLTLFGAFLSDKIALFVVIAYFFFPTVCRLLSTLLRPSCFLPLYYRCGILPSLMRTLLYDVSQFLFLPYFAYIELNAALKAIYRLAVRKNLLEWTTADQADKLVKGSFSEYAVKMLPQLLGLLTVFNFRYLPLALIWIAAVPYAWTLSKTNVVKYIQKTNTDPIIKDMWKYFSDNLTEKNNFLPPDNVQERPLETAAERTSPTNIGLTMLCILGAYDMGFISEEKTYSLLDGILSTVEKLEKYKGHLYNWYDTRSLEPLVPKYVSTVDNGNFICSVYTLKNGLGEFQTPAAYNLCSRLDIILRTTDFRFLYCSKRDLFYVGFDAERNEYSNSFYDLYASESRLTSYYAIACGQIPKRHWKTLGRPATSALGSVGIMSWSGTAFEFLMPHIFLPIYEGSMTDEMIRFAVDEQIRAAEKVSVIKKDGIPWGVSESAFYSFGPDLNYQYKAFGTDSIALKNSSETSGSYVVSPYSTFLALPIFPEKSADNLKTLDEYDLYGRYGYYEAADFPASGENTTPNTVCSFMVHHIGMSFLSCVNLHRNNIFQKRFMDTRMSAFSLLLEEKLPEYTGKADNTARERFTQKKERYALKTDEYSILNPECPNFRAFSDGKYTLLVNDCGEGISTCGTKDINFYRRNDSNGIFAFAKVKNNVIPFSYAPLFDNNFAYRTYLEDGLAEFYVKCRYTELCQTVTILPERDCEIREYRIMNESFSAFEAQVLIYLEPILQERLVYSPHPAFSNLFMGAEYDKEKGILTISRRNRETASYEMCLCVSLSVKTEYEFELSRFNVLDTYGGKASLISAFEKAFTNEISGPADVCAAMRFGLSVAPKSSSAIKLFLCAGDSPETTKAKLLKAIFETHDVPAVAAKVSASVLSSYKLCGMGKDEVKIYELLLNSLLTPKPLYNNLYTHKNILGKESLWKFGISGDYPLIVIKTDEYSVQSCKSFIKAFHMLKKQNIGCEFVICFSENGSYERKIFNALRDEFRDCDAGRFLDKRNGAFLVNIYDINDFALICSLSVFSIDLNTGFTLKKHRERYIRPEIRNMLPVKIKYQYKTGIGGFLKDGFATDDKKIVGNKPPWCQVLANPVFGTLVSDGSLGFTYALNSYMNKITPWYNDAVSDNSGEKLLLIIGKGKNRRTYDIVNGSSAIFKKGYAEYIGEAEDIRVRITVFVPVRIAAKIIKISIENGSPETVRIKYVPKIIMSDSDNCRTVNNTREDDVLYFTNSYNSAFGKGCVCLFGDGMKPDGALLSGYVSAGSSEEKTAVIGYALSVKQAGQLCALLTKKRCELEFGKITSPDKNRIEIRTPSEELNLLYNTFLPEQIIHCRIYAKTGFYQCSGAYGFRDQLQDAVCAAMIDTQYLKKQLLRCASHQFVEGDVMHWFHFKLSQNDGISGLRTRSSDDLLWLPYAVCEYIEKTADFSFLDRKRPYITGKLLEKDEDEKFIKASLSDEKDSIYGHCKRAITFAVKKGPHGLLLFGYGDWNDGINKIGNGETVLGTFFIIIVLEKFAKTAKMKGDDNFADFCIKTAEFFRNSVENTSWSGDRFIRGFYPSGKPFGDDKSEECKIDILAQSFAAIAGGFPDEKVKTALDTADKLLVDKENKIVKLFTPPFNSSSENPGYIMSYIPGVRENGGQYTHAAIWYALALLKEGLNGDAFRILDMINPINHTRTKEDVILYRNEPYVLSADVYTNKAHYGMGGWSWYTGSAGWYFKTVTESILGIKQEGSYLMIAPRIPENWNGYEANIRRNGAKIKIRVVKGAESGTLTVDGEKRSVIPLDGQNHDAVYIL